MQQILARMGNRTQPWIENLLVKAMGSRKVLAMETHRIVAAAVTLLSLSATAAHAQVYLELGINKRHFQTNSQVVRFDSGELNLFVRDGLITLAPCSSDPQLFFYGPHLGCALGITGYIASGDFNRDGVRDDNQYWSIDQVTPAFLIEPGRPDLCLLASAPPSKLPRPLKIFADGSVTTFHDLRTAQVSQYELSLYELIRRYGSVRQVETAVARGSVTTSGTINVVVTGADIVGSPLTVPVTVNVELEDGEPVPVFAEEWAENVRVALAAVPAITDFYSVGGSGENIVLTEIVPSGNDPTLNIALEAGTATNTALPQPISTDTLAGVLTAAPAVSLKQMNEELVTGRYVFTFPRLGNPDGIPVALPVTIVPNMEAVGSTRSKKAGFRFSSGTYDNGYYQMDPRLINTITWTGNDRSVVVPGDLVFFSILNPAQDFQTFPPTIPQTPVLLSSPLAQSYTLPPSFYDVGQEGVINLRFQRNLPINNVSLDRSVREMRTNLRFVDTYPGFAQTAFPLGTIQPTAPAGDFDHDGMSNIKEFAYQFPTNEDINAIAREQFVPGLVPESGTDGFPLLVEEFSRVIEKETEPVTDGGLQPAGPVGPELDGSNHVVFKVPYRARTGTSLRYGFVEKTTNARGKVKTKKIKPGAKWTLTTETLPAVARSVHIEVTVLDPTTREIYFIRTRPALVTVNVAQEMLVLRSAAPVNPAAPLPVLDVIVTPVDLR